MNAFAGFRHDDVADVPLLWKQDTRFKTFRISLGFQRPMDDAMAARALLPALLLQGTRAHPDRPALARRMDELYGALVAPGLGRSGESQVLRFTLDAVAGSCLPGGPDQVGAGFDLLAEYLTDPLLEDGGFRAETFARERSQAVAAARAVVDDKGAFAMQEARRRAFEGEPLATPDHGGVAALEALTAADPERARQDSLTRGRVWCVAMGALPDDLPQRTSELVGRLPERRPEAVPDPVQVDRRAPRRHCERVEVQQSRQVLVFRMPAVRDPQRRAAAVLMANVLGGGPHSQLFREVREARSLAYTISAHADPLKGYLIVSAGLDEASAAPVRDEVQRQLEALAAGAVTDEELATSKAAILGPFAAVHDSIAWRMQFTIDQWLQGTDATPEQKVEIYRAVTRDDVAAAASAVWHDFEFLLAPREPAATPPGEQPGDQAGGQR